MPLHKEGIAQELEGKKSELSGGISREAVEEFREAAQNLSDQLSKQEISSEVQEIEFPGAIPTEEFEENGGMVVRFEESSDWGSHEAVNRWARRQLEGVTTIAADGSQIDPVTEFGEPVGLVQVVWMANHHSIDGEYDEEAETEVLTSGDLLFENPNTGHMQVDGQEVPLTRFELETRVLEKQIEQHSDDEDPPVVLYDGPFILSFIQMVDQKAQERYSEALTRLLAASRYHEVPVVGYVSGSRATEIGNMIRNLDLVDASQNIRDYRFLEPLMENWGDRTPLFYAGRDRTQDRLRTKYQGREYDFSDKILFTYLDIGPGTQIDRVALPEWVYDQGLVEYVMSVVRAEAGVGRGYPEILQSVDADAVISRQDRQEFLRIYQEFSKENDIELEWNNKALSKKRRRR